MKTQFMKFTLAAGFVLALAFTVSCSSDDNEGKEQSSSSDGGSSSSNGAGGSSSSNDGDVAIAPCPDAVTITGSVACGGKTYKTVAIGSQTWMAENLNYAIEGSKCYENQESLCETHGRLYDWSTAMALPSCNVSNCVYKINSPHRGICPSGWHIPSVADWEILMGAVGGSSTAGTYLKATSGWNTNNGQDTYEFSALPGGRGITGGSFSQFGESGYWWNTHEVSSTYGNVWSMSRLRNVADGSNSYKAYFNSVRCVQDEGGSSSSDRDISSSSGAGSSSSDEGNSSSSDRGISSSSDAGSSSSNSEVAIVPCPNGAAADNSVICGGESYEVVEIGEQVWMAENLNYNPGEGNSACYNGDPANCATYGRLYDWSTAMALPSSCNSTSCASSINSPHRGICPDGWHIPSNEDWETLMGAVDGSATAGTHLKAASGWNENGNGQDAYGFSALPGGGGFSGDLFKHVGDGGYWWSASENNNSTADYGYMYYYDEDADWLSEDKSLLFSVRCVQD